MNLITKEEFDKLAEEYRYWRERWSYIGVVANILEQESFDTVLEMGNKGVPIVKGSDSMDIEAYEGLTYLHDAKITPWPLKDKEYDVFIALQVWEHLRDKQEDAFKEVIRCSKIAILSFPYKWNCPNDPMHHNIDENRIKKWTLGIKPTEIIPVITSNSENSRNRIIYVFKF